MIQTFKKKKKGGRGRCIFNTRYRLGAGGNFLVRSGYVREVCYEMRDVYVRSYDLRIFDKEFRGRERYECECLGVANSAQDGKKSRTSVGG